jgi:ribulose-phosphate 3-epimerase
VVEAGAEMLVAGSAIFAPGRTEQNAKDFLKVVHGIGSKSRKK